ncbi:MAG: hypothetical protein ACJ8MO_40525 [Bacillus sp. (in: firmicutes)]
MYLNQRVARVKDWDRCGRSFLLVVLMGQGAEEGIFALVME